MQKWYDTRYNNKNSTQGGKKSLEWNEFAVRYTYVIMPTS